MDILPLSFYLRNDVTKVARELLGKVLVTNWNNELTSGRIVETEAYNGEVDKASHASKGKTKRTEVMYREGGKAYVYLIYGIHQMFNIVTNKADMPHAVLIRAVEPIEGIDIMMKRRSKKVLDETVTKGPGSVGQAFGFHTSQTGHSLISNELYVMDDGFEVDKKLVTTSPRIGVDYAGEDAALHYRFFIKGNPYVSGKIR
jgi:DNA-3-methyladenine glycosylase